MVGQLFTNLSPELSEREMFEACGSHWFSQHQPPDLQRALALEDPVERVYETLGELYPYFEEVEGMIGKILRDALNMPVLREVVDAGWGELINGIRRAMIPCNLRTTIRRRLRITLDQALDIRNWSKMRAAGLSNDQAARLAADWFSAALETRRDIASPKNTS